MAMIGGTKNYILRPQNINEDDYQQVGEEGLRQALMSSMGLNTPPSFIVTSVAFDDFLTAADLVTTVTEHLSKVAPDDLAAATLASEQIQQSILSSTFPSVLLSPLLQAYQELGNGRDTYTQITPSWILENEKYLIDMGKFSQENIYGEDKLLVAIKNAWVTLFTPEAITERAKDNYQGALSSAVSIERMLPAEISGFAYNFDPDNQNKTHIYIQAVNGLSSSQESPTAHDSYKVDISDMHVLETKIASQEFMLLLKSRPSADDQNYMRVPISEQWQQKQKLDNKYISELSSIVTAFSSHYHKANLRFDFALKGGELYITGVEEVRMNTVKPFVHHHIELPSNSTPESIVRSEVDLDKLVEEVQDMAELDSASVPAETTYESLPDLDETEEIEILTPPSSEPIVAKEIDYNFGSQHSQLYLNVSTAKSEILSFAQHFQGALIDLTTSVLRHGIFPEEVLEDQTKTSELINKLASDIGIAARATKTGNLIILFSNFTADTYHQFNRTIGPIGATRFRKLPQLLVLEYLAVKKAKRDFGIGSYQLVLPSAHSYQELIDLKSTLGHNGFRRSSIQNLGINLDLPATELVLDETSSQEIDFGFISIDGILSKFMGKNYLEDEDLPVMVRKIRDLFRRQKTKKLATLVSIGTNWHILQSMMEMKPDILAMDNIPGSLEVDIIKMFELSDKDLEKIPQKRGRKKKQI